MNNQHWHTVRMSPLMTAAAGGHAEVVDELLAAGAQVTLKDRGGRTAAGWAKAMGYDGLGKELTEQLTPHANRKRGKVAPVP